LRVNAAAGGGTLLTGGDAGTVDPAAAAFWSNTASNVHAGTALGSTAVSNALTAAPVAQVGLQGADAFMVNNSGHGIAITADHTTITGGTNSSAMTLSNNGATFSNTATGGTVQVHGVSDGTDGHDAINVNQLNRVETVVSQGVATAMAMANIPQVEPGKTFSLGVGAGSFGGQGAFAAGGSWRINDNLVIKTSVGSADRGKFGVGGGASLSW
jgi:hypothetical protein